MFIEQFAFVDNKTVQFLWYYVTTIQNSPATADDTVVICAKKSHYKLAERLYLLLKIVRHVFRSTDFPRPPSVECTEGRKLIHSIKSPKHHYVPQPQQNKHAVMQSFTKLNKAVSMFHMNGT